MIQPNRALAATVIFLLLSLLRTSSSFSQSIEAGLFIGGSNYYGDLTNKDMLNQTHPAGGIMVRYYINEKWAAKGFLGYGRISGADSLSSKSTEKIRNLSFYSDLFEISAQFEYNLVRYDQHYYASKVWVPYLFFGLGVYNFNPKALLAGKTYELQPLGTEGQGSTIYNSKQKYPLTQFCIPLGIGIKKRLSKRWTIGAEFGFRYTYTNYMDDVGGVYGDYIIIKKSSGETAAAMSDRSAAKNPIDPTQPVFSEGMRRSFRKTIQNDIYMMGGISILYTFRNANVRCPAFNNSKK